MASRLFTLSGRATGSALMALAVTAWWVQAAQAQTSYTLNNTGNVAALDWHNAANWTPNTAFPNAPGDGATFIRPLITPSGAFTINLPATGTDTTVGSITVDNTTYNNGNITRINTLGGKLIFQSTSGAATYTENAGTDTDNSGRIEINAPITLLSDLVVTQDNIIDLNTGTIFSGVITGASNVTFTKNGAAGLQLNYAFALGATEGFEGKYVINNGSIRLLNAPGIAKSTGITVNSGGQLQLGQSSTVAVPDWSLASGATLKLKGPGKGVGHSPDGALRFQPAAGNTTTFHNPVELLEDARIHVGAANSTGVIDSIVSGPGDLVKSGNGTLIITNAANSYTGDTQILAATMSIASPYLADAADVYLTTGAIFDLNFSGPDDIRSLYIDNVAQPIGTYDSTHPSGLFTGSGSLNVTALPALNDADFDGDDDVDGNDFLIWQRGVGTAGGQPEGNADGLGGIDGDDLEVWKTQFGIGGMVSSNAAPAPEPATAILALAAVCGIAALRRRPRAA